MPIAGSASGRCPRHTSSTPRARSYSCSAGRDVSRRTSPRWRATQHSGRERAARRSDRCTMQPPRIPAKCWRAPLPHRRACRSHRATRSRQRRRRRASTTLPRFGNVHLLHFTDCHAQLLPVYFREPSVNIGVGARAGQPPHLVGEHLLKHFGIAPRHARGARVHVPRLRRGRARRTARSAASRTWRRW